MRHEVYEIGVPYYADYVEAFNSDDAKFGGGGITNGTVTAKEEPMHNEQYRISIDLPPMSVMFFEIKNKRTAPSELAEETGKSGEEAETKADKAEIPDETSKPEKTEKPASVTEPAKSGKDKK